MIFAKLKLIGAFLNGIPAEVYYAIAAACACWYVYDAGGDAREEKLVALWEVAVDQIVEERMEIALAAAVKDADITADGVEAIEDLREEIDDAVANLPDQVLTDRQLARACAELRRQGGDC